MQAIQRLDMPYDDTAELPKGVSDNLPQHAQTIYMEAFNNAWDQYKDPEDRQGDDDREETAHKVAWSAVKQSYQKNDQGNWVKKDS